jgi:hypothetical protein
MPFGFAGKALEVDLTSCIVKKNYSNIEHYLSRMIMLNFWMPHICGEMTFLKPSKC